MNSEQEITIEPAESLDYNLYVIGRINEEMTASFIPDLFNLAETICDLYPDENERPYITVTINTFGGDLLELFALYDAMRRVQKMNIKIETIGLGKVMSSGLLLLAAGTKGLRTVGKHTRLMFHEVNGDMTGTHKELTEQKAELDYVQEQYISALCFETKKTKKFFDNLLKKHMDYHFTAEEAVQWKIADKIE